MHQTAPPTSWFSLARLRRWKNPERAAAFALGVAAIVALVIGGIDDNWIAGALFLGFIASNVIVYRRGGWHLLGPHFYYDVIRLARRGRSTLLRIGYILALLIGLSVVLLDTPHQETWTPNDFARVSERFTYVLFLVQNMAIMILAPAYLGSAIAEEKERRTLELLFTTHLSNQEIVLGKLFARLIHLMGFVLAGLPVLTMVQFWGGVDMLLVAGNLTNTLLNTLSLASICLLMSTLARTVTGAVLTSYALILPVGFCCVFSLKGFPFVLQDARSAGGGGVITVQNLGILCLVHLVIVVGFLSLAIAALREAEPLGAVFPPPAGRLDVDYGSPRPGAAVTAQEESAIQATPRHTKAAIAPVIEPPRKRAPEPENEFALPYTLPPVGEHALLWKERYVGGPPWFFSPIVLVPALPFIVTGILVMGFWFLRALFLSRQDFEQSAQAWSIVLRVLYYLGLSAYVLGVGFRASSSVARERQQQTLEPLLLLPIERSEILWAKLIGCVWRGWPWLLLLALNIIAGTIVGVYHPVSAVVLCLAPWAFILFVAGLGMLLSVVVPTVLRANLMLLTVVVFLIAASFLTPRGITPPLGYLEPFAFPVWGDVWGERSAYAISAAAMMFIYIVMGTAFLGTAFTLFERRSHAESV